MNETLLALVLIIFSANAAADWCCRDTTNITNNYTEVTHVVEETNTGTAMAIAVAQHHFGFGTYSWQGSASAGFYDGEQAYSAGLAKRFEEVLINGTISRESDETGYGIGANFRF